MQVTALLLEKKAFSIYRYANTVNLNNRIVIMDSEQRYEKTAKILTDNGQGQLLTFYDRLSDAQKRHLLNQIECLDFSQIPAWIANHVKNAQPVAVPDRFEPAPAYPPRPKGPIEQ